MMGVRLVSMARCMAVEPKKGKEKWSVQPAIDPRTVSSVVLSMEAMTCKNRAGAPRTVSHISGECRAELRCATRLVRPSCTRPDIKMKDTVITKDLLSQIRREADLRCDPSRGSARRP